MVRKFIPDRGDVIWITLDPISGREQRGRRPALVISPKLYNAKTGLALCCPITSVAKGYPFEVEVSAGDVRGVILSDHIRTLDWVARRARLVGKAESAVATLVEEKLLLLIKHGA